MFMDWLYSMVAPEWRRFPRSAPRQFFAPEPVCTKADRVQTVSSAANDSQDEKI
jgi:hypothetical protein